jgi:hypothetical protein
MIKTSINKLLFFDLETVGVEKDFKTLKKKNAPLAKQFEAYEEWFKKRYPEDKDLSIDELFLSKAGLLPEFNKIIVASFAIILPNGKLHKQTFADDDEKTLLTGVRSLLNSCYEKEFSLCGHNIKLFDMPTLAKRMIINGLKPSPILPAYDTKPWEIKAVDTKDFWQYGNNFSIATLELMCTSLGVESSKTGEIKGENVHDSYWSKKQLKEIAEYCEKDVDVLTEVITKLDKLV